MVEDSGWGAGTRSSDTRDLSRILVAFDGSESAVRACRVAANLAKNCGSDVTVLHIIPSLSIFTSPLADEYYAHHQREAKKLAEIAASLVAKEGVAETRREIIRARNSVVQTIVEYAAEKKIDLIVIGSRGPGGFRGMLMGSVSNGVVTHAHCPVLVVK